MSSCFGCGGLQPEVKLLNDCYPPSKALLTAGPDFKPLSSDLSKLTYRCTNQSSKLAKVGEELDRRVAKESTRSTGGYAKSRASLLISLAILRALINECRRDLALFSRSIMRIVNAALEVKVYQKGGADLEVIGRAASCFIAYTTYAEGNSIGVDDAVTNTYLQVLRKFALLATTRSTGEGEKVDLETQNRTRLIGLAALNGVSSSDAIFASTTDSKKQIELIIPALLLNIFEGPIEAVKVETAKMEMDSSPSPFFTEFSARRPINDRRAPSVHAHIPGEKGPTENDVLSAALRSLEAMVRQCNVTTASQVLDAVAGFFDRLGWNDVERSCWLTERLASALMLQYRFVVPTRLMEVMFDLEDKAPTRKHTTVLAMITTILNSPISLVGLGVTDLLNSLVALIVRRIHIDEGDALLPPLVQCIASLGTHIYYADQINDIVEELALRMGEIPATDKARPEIIRVLIYAITGVLNKAISADIAEARATAHHDNLQQGDKGKGVAVDTPTEIKAISSGRRNPVTVEVWQETLPLLCESTYAVRAAYARALILFLVNEMPREKRQSKADAATYRFCNAVHAAVYTLAMSSCLGSGSPAPSVMSPSGSPVQAAGDLKDVSATDSAAASSKMDSKAGAGEKGVSFNITEPTPSGTPGDSANGTNGASTPTKRQQRRGSRRVSLPLNRLNSNTIVTSFENVATPFDFAVMVRIVDELHAAVPGAALITGVPMLLALDRDAGTELVRRAGDGRQGAWVSERKRSIREVVSICWKRLGDRWGIPEMVEYANGILNSLPEPFEVPNPAPPLQGILPPPEEPTRFFENTVEGESSSATRPLLDPEVLLRILGSSSAVTASTGIDDASLARRLAADWTVESALKNAVERLSPAHVRPADDPHYDVANVLMNMSNPSYQSFGRPQSKAVDVTDLREALGGRADGGTPSAPPSIVSTAEGRSVRGGGAGGAGDGSVSPIKQRHPASNTDVQEVLKDIFKNSKSKKNRARGGSQGNQTMPAAPGAPVGTAALDVRPNGVRPEALVNGSNGDHVG